MDNVSSQDYIQGSHYPWDTRMTQAIEVPYVCTDQNPADFLTKPMKSASRFRELRRIVMNIPDDDA